MHLFSREYESEMFKIFSTFCWKFELENICNLNLQIINSSVSRIL